MENSISQKSPKISVVAPVYKVEKYLHDCVESVLAQSFTDFELIFVDDGSPDKCGEICDELAKKDSRIRVFHQANGGEALARGLGVEHARGEWINFVDADDLLPKDALKNLIDEASDDVDWVQGMHCNFDDGETPKEVAQTGKVKNLDLVGIAENVLLHHPAPWGKIVRRNLFTPYVMAVPREIKIGPDVQMNIRLIANRPRKGKEIDKTVYHYRLRESSIIHSCLSTESYNFRYFKLLFPEARKISTPSNKERISRALSRHVCGGTETLIAYGLPMKFPHRRATLIHRGARSNPRYFFIYLCLRFNCVGVARIAAKVFGLLKGKKFDVKGRRLLE